MSTVCLDTSVLAKRYLPAPEPEKVEALLERAEHRFVLSELVVELESALRRRAAERGPRAIDGSRLA